MSRFTGKTRRPSTVMRDNEVLDLYKEIRSRLGEMAYYVPKSYFYDKIHERTGLCTRTISFIINHVRNK